MSVFPIGFGPVLFHEAAMEGRKLASFMESLGISTEDAESVRRKREREEERFAQSQSKLTASSSEVQMHRL